MCFGQKTGATLDLKSLQGEKVVLHTLLLIVKYFAVYLCHYISNTGIAYY